MGRVLEFPLLHQKGEFFCEKDCITEKEVNREVAVRLLSRAVELIEGLGDEEKQIAGLVEDCVVLLKALKES
ncbi:MAG: hypothetical protein D6780_08025 [Candidatus Dadabacteria bacterium]|nr:MAG: hypothetical protein D6780_08025 [Candidatus Dadabacteria bacterium]